MKKLLPLIWAAGLSLLLSLPSFAQTYPSPTYQNTTVLGTLTVAGHVFSPTTITQSCLPIENFGGAGDGTTDNSGPLGTALTSFGTASGCISFGAGTYKFVSAVTATYTNTATQSFSLRGAGADATVLLFPTTAGISFIMGATVFSSFHLSDFTFATGAAAAGNAFTATYHHAQSAFPPTSDITRVTFRADDVTANTHYWTNAIRLVGVSYVNMDGINVIGKLTGSPASGGLGTGISLAGDSSLSSYGVIFNIDHSNLNYLGEGVLYGDFIQGVTIQNTNINFNTNGLQTATSPVGVLAGLLIQGSNFNNYGNNIVTNAPISIMNIVNNLFIVFANTSGVICQPCGTTIISGNGFSSVNHTATQGIVIGPPNTGPVMITGNTFTNFNIAVETSTGASGINLQSNTYTSNATNVSNFGSISAGTCSGVTGGTCSAGASF